MISAVLGIDQAARSGWAIACVGGSFSHPMLVEHGVATTAKERRTVVEHALAQAGGDARGLLVMFEDHAKMPLTRLTQYDHQTSRRRRGAPERSTASILGQGESRGWWNEQLNLVEHPTRLRDAVEPRTWRARVLGSSRGDTAALKEAAKRFASARLRTTIDDDNEAEGICICTFAMVDGIARLDVRRTKARLYARASRNERRQLELKETP